MKEFDIELAKQGKPVCTRDGRPVRIICWDCKGEDPIIGLVEHNGVECPLFCKGDGKVRGGEEMKVLDLMMATKKDIKWVLIYRCGEKAIVQEDLFDSEEEARESARLAGVEIIKLQKIELED